MFSSAKPQPKPQPKPEPRPAMDQASSHQSAYPKTEAARPATPTPPPAANATKHPPSNISADLFIKGDISTTGDMTINGRVNGDISAKHITIGDSAEITGEVSGDDIVINGVIKGSVRGVKVRLTATARVEGDIIHKTIAIEAGAKFDGSVQRSEDPLKSAN